MHDKPHAIAFDLDGTLSESKQRMSSEMGVLIGELLARMPVAVMTGASFAQFENQFFVALPMDANFKNLYIFPDNAAQCFVYRDGTWKPQYDYAFTKEERERILKMIDESVVAAGIKTPPQLWGERVEDRGAEIAFSALGQKAPLEAKEKWHKEHEAERDALREALTRRLPEYAVSEGGLTTIQITHKGLTKAFGIQRLSELTGVAVAEMLYVGDALDEGGNDSAVKETKVPTRQVFGPEETLEVVESVLR